MSRTLPRFGGFRLSRLVSRTSGVFIIFPFVIFRSVFEDADADDPVLPEPQHREQEVLVADLVPFGRQPTEETEHEPAHGLELVFRELDAELLVEFPDVRFPV